MKKCFPVKNQTYICLGDNGVGDVPAVQQQYGAEFQRLGHSVSVATIDLHLSGITAERHAKAVAHDVSSSPIRRVLIKTFGSRTAGTPKQSEVYWLVCWAVFPAR